MNFNWADDTNCAVTVCDTEGVVIYQNKQSISVNGSIAAKACSPATTSARRGSSPASSKKATRMPTPSRKRDPQNDLPNSLAPRGRHRRRYHRTVDADSCRNAALRTGIIEHPGPEASEPLNDTRNFNRKAAKIHETTPIRYRRRVKRPPFFQNVTKRRIKTVYNTFHSRFPKTGAPAISRGRSCLFAYYRNFSNPGRYLVGSNSTIV